MFSASRTFRWLWHVAEFTTLNLVWRFSARHDAFCFSTGCHHGQLAIGRQMLFGSFRETLGCFTNIRLPTAGRKFINELSGKHWSDDLVTAKGRPIKRLLRLWPSVYPGLDTQAQPWAWKSDRQSRKAIGKSLLQLDDLHDQPGVLWPSQGCFSEAVERQCRLWIFTCCCGQTLRILVKKPSVSQKEPNNMPFKLFTE